MKTSILASPRRFDPDGSGQFFIVDLGSIELAADEQITFANPSGSEYDVARKSWGYYATPSLNGRLPSKGLRPALVRNDAGRCYLCLVEKGMQGEFRNYLASTGMQVLGWLDDTATLDKIESVLREA